MCGIVGLIDGETRSDSASLEAQLRAMADTLVHRGPDSNGTWADAETGAAFGFRRLSIIELTEKGNQPMRSDDGRYVIVYNGEIYNFVAIRNVLKSRGIRFSGNSDTEVLLKACMEWGVERTVRDLVGMFAFAFWDNRERRLWIARDRLGIKPLFYGEANGRFVFSSELKALRALQDWQPEIDREALAGFLGFNYVPAPASIYKGIYKLEPGCILTRGPDGKTEKQRYWDIHDAYNAPIIDADEQEAVGECRRLLSEAVEQRMIADVSLGALLSGGIDSTTVVAMMNVANPGAVRTFTIGFGDQRYDEADHARDIARHIGTDHTAIQLSPESALDLIPALPDIYDEPFADSSALPTYLVSKLAREHVTVALSGDGGDEVFFGYNRYVAAAETWRRSNDIPLGIRRFGACLLQSISPAAWDRLAMLVPEARRPRTLGVKIHKLADVLRQQSEEDVYGSLVGHWRDRNPVLPGDLTAASFWPENDPSEFSEKMALADSITYLPDDILAKVDRASMANSLEVRVPMLDHRLVEFAARLPASLKLKGGTTKYLLRRVLDGYVPRGLVDRPKMGFAVPLDRWLRGPLRDWAENLLDEKRLREDGRFDAAVVRNRWQRHLAGRGNHQEELWGILMAQAWLERWA